jgi:hypothetical protein
MGFPSSDAVRSAEHKKLTEKGFWGREGQAVDHSENAPESLLGHEVIGIDAIASAPAPAQPSAQNSSGSKGIVLPPLQCEAFLSQRHEVNPALALNLLQEIQSSVGLWQQQQRQIVQAMHRLYAQGPMVDGWLQSSLLMTTPQPLPVDASATVLRHGDPEALMKYVEALENSAIDPLEIDTRTTQAAQQSGDDFSDTAAQYQLCSLKEDGSICAQLCPPEQMALVSTAIARYQKFKQLVSQKQVIEAKLQQAVDLLSGVRHQLQMD